MSFIADFFGIGTPKTQEMKIAPTNPIGNKKSELQRQIQQANAIYEKTKGVIPEVDPEKITNATDNTKSAKDYKNFTDTRLNALTHLEYNGMFLVNKNVVHESIGNEML